MTITTTYLDRLPTEIYQQIIEHVAAIQIQEYVFKLFYKNYGPTWQQKIKERSNTLVYDLDFFCYLNGIADPWYDYCDDPKYAYYTDRK